MTRTEMKLRSIPKEMFDETKRLEEILSVIRKHNLVKNGLTPETLRHILEDLGPTFIKIGQIMSSRVFKSLSLSFLLFIISSLFPL